MTVDERVWVRRRMAKSHGKIPTDFIFDPHMKARELFYDDFSDTYYWSSRVAILAAELAVNRRFQEEGYVSLGTYYDLVGNQSVPQEYQLYYWTVDNPYGYYWIDFDHIFMEASETPDGRCDCHMIIFADQPMAEDEYELFNSPENLRTL